ncbi:hypothetical protein M5689_010536 [Euphorbia peplus]|nr:hypothetical protein M5689_010536 [Euphorbia peplus]
MASLIHFPAPLLSFVSVIFFSLVLANASLISLPHTALMYGEDIHGDLPIFGFPPGLIPNFKVISYELSENSWKFVLKHDAGCLVNFNSELILYEGEIKGQFQNNLISDVCGIKFMKMGCWIDVTEIRVVDGVGDKSIMFSFGSDSVTYSAIDFSVFRDCSIMSRIETMFH